MRGKEGLDYEIGEVMTLWRNEGKFALLHDLTNILRIGDLTVFGEDGPRVVEVKRNPSALRRRQLARMQAAFDMIKSSASLSLAKEPLPSK